LNINVSSLPTTPPCLVTPQDEASTYVVRAQSKRGARILSRRFRVVRAETNAITILSWSQPPNRCCHQNSCDAQRNFRLKSGHSRGAEPLPSNPRCLLILTTKSHSTYGRHEVCSARTTGVLASRSLVLEFFCRPHLVHNGFSFKTTGRYPSFIVAKPQRPGHIRERLIMLIRLVSSSLAVPQFKDKKYH
jgi:hypothetical protein